MLHIAYMAAKGKWWSRFLRDDTLYSVQMN